MRGRRLACATAALAAIAAVATGGGASASGVSLASGTVHLTLPAAAKTAGAAAASSNNLAYNGGPVEQAGTVNYAIYWEPGLAFGVSAKYNSVTSQFLRDIGGSALYGIASQYFQVSGGVQQNIVNSSSFGGAWVDTSLYPTNPLLDSQIQAEVSKAISVNHWTAGIGHEFFVFTGKNEIVCSGVTCSNAVFCAYHSSFTSGSQVVLYADHPYPNTLPTGCNTPSSPNGDLDADSAVNVMSHELMETVTDPEVGTPQNLAWVDSRGNEIGDKCNFTFGPTDASGADVTLNGHPYIVQQEWSNRANGGAGGCTMS